VASLSSHKRVWPKLLLLIATYLAFSVGHAIWVPIFEGPDEPGNLNYIRYIDVEGKLATPSAKMTYELEHLPRGILPPFWFLAMKPVYQGLGMDAWAPAPVGNRDFFRDKSRKASGRAPTTTEEVLAEPMSRLFFHHGGDEADGTGVFSGAVGSIRMFRLTTALWGALALVAAWLTLRRALGCENRALWFTALLAWTPQLQFLSGTVTMDLTVAAFGCLALWCMVEWIAGTGGQGRWALGVGVFTGLCSITKLNGLVLIPVLVMAALLASRHGRLTAKSALLAVGGFGSIAGPYFFAALLDSGHPLWMWHYQMISDYHNPEGFEAVAWSGLRIWHYFQTIFLTWFADFGWASVWFPAWISLPVMGVMAVSGALGVALVSRKARLGLSSVTRGAEVGSFVGAEHRRASAFLLLLAAAITIQLAEMWFNLHIPQPQGRHLYPFLVAVIFPVGLGLERLRLLKPVALVCLVLCFAAFPMLVGRLRPVGWNQSPGMAMTDEHRKPRPLITTGEATVKWLVDGHTSSSWPIDAKDAVTGGPPPLLTWEAKPGALYEAYLALDNPMMLDEIWRKQRSLVRGTVHTGAPLAGTYQVPADFWSKLEPGQELDLQILEVGLDGKATGYSVRRHILR
jgi:hypothetical protein